MISSSRQSECNLLAKQAALWSRWGPTLFFLLLICFLNIVCIVEAFVEEDVGPEALLSRLARSLWLLDLCLLLLELWRRDVQCPVFEGGKVCLQVLA